MCTSQVTADPCLLGHYCLEGTGYNTLPCPSGTFGSRMGLSDITQCTNCTAGSYCQGTGLINPTGPCDPGYWCFSGVDKKTPTSSIDHSGIGGKCFLGHECPGNTALPLPCSPGYFSDEIGLNACKICPAGKLTSIQQ